MFSENVGIARGTSRRLPVLDVGDDPDRPRPERQGSVSMLKACSKRCDQAFGKSSGLPGCGYIRSESRSELLIDHATISSHCR